MEKIEFYLAFGRKIAEARKRKGISQTELGNFISLSRASILNIEKGRQQINLYQFWRITAFLNIDVTKLFQEIQIGNNKIETFGKGLSKSALSSISKFIDEAH